MKSMTGYGHYSYTDALYDIEVEIRSVNHRFLDLTVNCSSSISHLEPMIREIISKSIFRGKVYCNVMAKSKATEKISLDKDLFNHLVNLYKEAFTETNIPSDIDLNQIMRSEGVLAYQQSKLTDDDFTKILLESIETCIERHSVMAIKEGEQTREWLKESVRIIKTELAQVEEYIPQYRNDLKERFKKNIEEVLSAPIDNELEKRIVAEVSFYMERYDITEEVVRVKDHLDKMETILHEDERESGKRMNFVVQEIHREVQTMGSKFNKVAVFNSILSMKEEVEKCRELIQNVE
ncbi:MAG: YicC/YloC family endoribonuclease [Candidatus Cloacimonadia bacterium]